jgi:hypothetical protein
MTNQEFAEFGNEAEALLKRYGINDPGFWTRKLSDGRYSFRIEGSVQTDENKQASIMERLAYEGPQVIIQ